MTDTFTRRGALIGLLPAPDGMIDGRERFQLLELLYWPPGGTNYYLPSLVEMAAGDFVNIGKYRVETWSFSDRLSLQLRDWKTRLTISAPPNVYNTTDFPNLDPNATDTVIPICYGKVFGIPATLIDTTTKEFKVVGHALTSFDGFYSDGGFFTPDSFDLSDGTFIWSGYDPENPTDVTVDATGIYTNPADVIEDLLTTWGGEPDSELLTPVDENDANYKKGFGAYGSRLKWVYGATRDGVEASCPEISLYIDELTPVLDIISKVVEAAFGRFYYHPSGYYFLDSYDVVRGASVPVTFTDADVFDLVPDVSTAEVITAVTVQYRRDLNTNVFQSYRKTSDEKRYDRNIFAHKELARELPFWKARDAQWWASKTLAMEGLPVRHYRATVRLKGWLCTPGMDIRLTYSKRAVSGLFEVLRVTASPDSTDVVLTICDRRGYKDRPCFWSSDTPAFPASLGGGSAETWDAGWTEAQKRYARENFGYWQNDNGYNDSNDSASYKGSVWL